MEADYIKGSSVRKLTFSSLFAALTAVGALISFPLPFSQVPVSLQTFFTITAGALLGARYGALSQVVYILLGVFGLPVFAGGASGFGVLVGPTGGYLFGFILGALVIGLITDPGIPSYPRILIGLIVGTIVIYTAGVIQLSLVAEMSLRRALALGVVPFLIGDSLKIIVAILVVRRTRRFVR